MVNKTVITAVSVLMLLSAAVYLRHHHGNGGTEMGSADNPPSLETVQQFFPDAANLDFLPGEDWFRVWDEDGGLIGFVVQSSPQMDSITGYSGPTPVMIALQPDGKISGLALMQHTETPGFIRQLHDVGFFNQWNGLTVEEAIAGKVDAVSGATMSSAAIAATVRGRLAMLADDVHDEGVAPSRRGFLTFQDGVILLVLLGAVLIHARSSFLAGRGWMPHVRSTWLLISLLLLGVYSATMFSMSLLDGWVNAGRIHGGAGIVSLVVLAVGWALVTGKNIYCSTLCPFGALQELSYRLTPLRLRLPKAVTKRLRYVRYVLVCLTIGYIILRIGLPPEMQEPFSAFRPRAAGLPAISFAVLGVLTAWAGINRPWCTYFCSSGALLDLVRKTGRKK